MMVDGCTLEHVSLLENGREIRTYKYHFISIWQIIATSAEVTPKWWFSKGIPPKMPLLLVQEL